LRQLCALQHGAAVARGAVPMTPTLAPDRLAEAARAYAHAAAALVAHNAAEPYEWDYRVSSRWQDAHRQWFRQWRTIVGTERLARAALLATAVELYPLDT
jgi:hypothetical protein